MIYFQQIYLSSFFPGNSHVAKQMIYFQQIYKLPNCFLRGFFNVAFFWNAILLY